MQPSTVLLPLAILFLSAGKPAAADVEFASQVQPVFVEHCAGCHGEKKGLGRLRLHTAAAIQKKWDADDHLIVKGKPDESELYERLVLPADHKKFMPKKGDPLPKEKLDLIRTWIEQGAAFTVATTKKPDSDATETDGTEQDGAEQHNTEQHNAEHRDAVTIEIPLPAVTPADEASIEQLRAAGAQVMPLYTGSNLLQVSFALRDEPATDDELTLLTAVAPQVYSLNLAKAQISNEGLVAVSALTNLAKLHLEKSSVTDSGLKHLSALENLQYLNLYGTQITDEGLKSLSDLKNLRKLYLWQTKATYDMAIQMEKAQPGLVVDLGFDHPVVMRMRLEKQLKQAEANTKAADEAFSKLKAEFDRAKQDQKAAKKRLDELKQQLDKLNGNTQATLRHGSLLLRAGDNG